MNDEREMIIQRYVAAYNAFDMDGMCQDLHDEVIFENIANGETQMRLEGKDHFAEQAEAAATYFSERKQSIMSIDWEDDKALVAIDYEATVAKDLPNGLQKGQKLVLKGQSIFHFEGRLIVKIQDIS